MWGRLGARLAACAAVGYRRSVVEGGGPIDNRLQLTKLPHTVVPTLVYAYAQLPAAFLMNRFGFHFYVAHRFLAVAVRIGQLPVIS